MTQESDSTAADSIKPTRRQVIATLGAAGAFAATGAAQTDSGELTAGGGEMADALSPFKVQWYELPESDLPDAGVEGRFVQITSGGANYSAGDVLRDTGSTWEKVDLGVGTMDATAVNAGNKMNIPTYPTREDAPTDAGLVRVQDENRLVYRGFDQ